MKIRRLIPIIFSVVFVTTIFTACKVSYSFTGANISPSVKTFSVYYFPNRARLVNPNLSQAFTEGPEGLQNKLIKQTSLSQVSEGGDLEFSGQITDYDVKPMNIQQGDLAALNRLTVTVKVKFVNNKDHTQDWEKTFSQYEDFESTKSLSAEEDYLVTEIVKKLADDIFNASVANW
jgi:hypothetical protein